MKWTGFYVMENREENCKDNSGLMPTRRRACQTRFNRAFFRRSVMECCVSAVAVLTQHVSFSKHPETKLSLIQQPAGAADSNLYNIVFF